jgi:hypothetical protein
VLYPGIIPGIFVIILTYCTLYCYHTVLYTQLQTVAALRTTHCAMIGSHSELSTALPYTLVEPDQRAKRLLEGR